MSWPKLDVELERHALPSVERMGARCGMMAKSHVVVGGAAWMVAAPMLHANPLDPFLFGLTIAGSLLPDIDHPKSWIGRRARPLSTGISWLLGHRGITHSALAAVAWMVLLQHAGDGRVATSALMIGYLSHLCADLLTPAGLRLAWPFQMRWALPICRTGSPAEPIIVVALVALVGWWLLSHHAGWKGIRPPAALQKIFELTGERR